MASGSGIPLVAEGRAGTAKSMDTEARLCCPLYRHDPQSCERSIACSDPGFPNIARLHEHLKRCHSRKTKRKTEPKAPVLSDHQFEQLSKVIQAHPRKQAFEKWKDMYKCLFPQDVCPTPFRPTLEGYVAETLQPSEAFKSRAIEKIIAGRVIPEGLDPELFFDLCCQITPLSAEAFGETGGRWGLQGALEVPQPRTRAGIDTRSSESVFPPEDMMEINDYDSIDMTGYDNETSTLYGV